jgi:hypothetical protein
MKINIDNTTKIIKIIFGYVASNNETDNKDIVEHKIIIFKKLSSTKL